MKKSILAIAVAATMAAPAAMAAPTVYGNIHLTILDIDSADNLDMNSNTSAIGVKGSEDLGDGLKAIYKMEFQVDVGDSGSFKGRDQFAGLKGGMGTVKFGNFSSNYKQMGGKVDSLYRTPAEGRGFIHTQSALHSGKDIHRGRLTNGVQYSSPKMGGMQLVANTTTSGSEEETLGLGVRWSSKNLSVYADWIDTQPHLDADFDDKIDDSISTTAATTESAFKVGGKYSAKAFFVGGQFESAEDVTGYDYLHLNGGYSIDANNLLTATYGTASHINNSDADTTGLALAYVHSLSKMTMVYAAYVDRSSDTDAAEDSAFALGIRKKF